MPEASSGTQPCALETKVAVEEHELQATASPRLYVFAGHGAHVRLAPFNPFEENPERHLHDELPSKL